ncbi:tyrosine-type recombinase/integrase [Desulfopila aestuarii]|nr:tyrosine-type recombinase/integrase [Desulfopila aestuarii]
MNIDASILNYKGYLKRKNYSAQSVNSYLYRLMHFLVRLPVQLESATSVHIRSYLDLLLEQRLAPKTVNERLIAIRSFYRYLHEEEGKSIKNPVLKGMALRLPKPLPRHAKQSELDLLFEVITKKRDRALFMLMLRCGLRVDEVANLSLDAIDYENSQIVVLRGKGAKDRTTYISNDAADALAAYLQVRQPTKEGRIFLVEKGIHKGEPISVRGIQKRIEYYSKKIGVTLSCHKLRHTMATQLLNAGADIVTIQELLGHSKIEQTMRYSQLSNMRAQHDYYKAMNGVMKNEYFKG